MTPERSSALVGAIAALSITSCSSIDSGSDGHDEHQGVHWGYEPDNGPDVWAAMDSEWTLCAEGLEQSPIDLTNATDFELPEVEIDTPSGQEVVVLNQAGVIDALDNGAPSG